MPKKNAALKELEKLRKEMEKVISEKGKPALIGVAQELFEFDEVQAVRWQQYTPSFNDGDPCEFSVTDVSVEIDSEEGDEDYEDGFFDSYSTEVKSIKGLEEAMDEISTTLSENEDVLEQIFGNNVEITVTREGKVKIDDYECGY